MTDASSNDEYLTMLVDEQHELAIIGGEFIVSINIHLN